MLSKKSQIQNTKYCMTSLIYNFQKWQIYKDRKLISGFLGLQIGNESDGKWENEIFLERFYFGDGCTTLYIY